MAFRNDDPYFHNVFSLSPGQGFDTGLYSAGGVYNKTFTRPGPVELLCNIHASMVGYIYVVNSAYYTQPRSNGAFVIRNVPPGRYELHAWHESAAAVVKQPVTVGARRRERRRGADPGRSPTDGHRPGQIREAPPNPAGLLTMPTARRHDRYRSARCLA